MDKKIIEAVELIRSFCGDHPRCKDCPFADKFDCFVADTPDNWPDFSEMEADVYD